MILRRGLPSPPAPRLAAAPVVACLLLSGCGGDDRPAAPKRVTVKVVRKVGNHARASATGIVDRPAAVAIRVSAAPRQRVVVTWGLACPKTNKGTDSGIGGSYVTIPPNVRALRLPRRKIAFCAVRVNARLTGRGRVKVTLLGSER